MENSLAEVWKRTILDIFPLIVIRENSRQLFANSLMVIWKGTSLDIFLIDSYSRIVPVKETSHLPSETGRGVMEDMTGETTAL